MVMRQRALNLQYAAVQGLYWMGFCLCVSFAAVYMQGKGYSNSVLGAVLAAGNLLGFALAPVLASAVDKTGRRGLFACIMLMLLLELVLQGVLAIAPGRGVLMSAGYCLYVAFVNAAGPLITQLAAALEQDGVYINFGVGRGVGSLAYSACAMLMGHIIEAGSADALRMAAALVALCQLALTLALGAQLRRSAPSESGGAEGQAKGLAAFVRDNGRFCALMLGTMFLYLAHNLVTSFLINVVRNVGGGTADMGGVTAFMAFAELPTLFLYDRICRCFGCPATVRFASVMFVVKALAIALADSVAALYAAHALQCLSYAMMTAASVRFVTLYVAPQDAAKGQAVGFGMTTLSSVFAGLFGGAMYDTMSVRAVLLITVGVAAVGAAVCIVYSRPKKMRQK